MKTNTQKRWILVVAVWGCALLLGFRNSSTIDDAEDAKHRKIAFEQERLYVESHADQINAVLQQYRSARQPIEALNIGLFELGKQLENDAMRFNLQKFQFDSQTAENEQVLFSVSLTGTLYDVLNWIAYTETAYPYIQIRKVNFSLEPNGTQALFSFDLLYRYHLTSAPIPGTTNES
jgi:hypothetical protein